jgi:hypothetical protein
MQPIDFERGERTRLLAWTARMPKSLTLTLLLTGLPFSVAPAAQADDGPASAAIAPSVAAGRDPWLLLPHLCQAGSAAVRPLSTGTRPA